MTVKVLAGGILGATEPAGPGTPRQVLRDVAAELGTTPAELAVRYVLSTPGVSTAVIGFSVPEHVTEAAAAAANAPLAAGHIQQLESVSDTPITTAGG